MKLDAGSRAFAHHKVTRTIGARLTASSVTAKGALVPRGTRPGDADWAPAPVTDTPTGLDVAVWCDLTDTPPDTRLDIWVDLYAGDERLLRRTGPLDVA